MKRWACVLAVVCACGGSSNNGSGSGGGAANATLSISISGQGTISSRSGFNCAASCTQQVPAGTAVHLDAAAATGMAFSGWSGACSGSGGCDLTVSGDTQVSAAFAGAATVIVQVAPTGTGTGRVTSSIPGIDCPTTCAMSVAPGTVLTLTATPGAGSTFAGWGGGCSGTSCSVTASSTTKTIFADFESSTQPAVLHALSVTATGPGSVKSTPAGIDCPGTCTANFPEGSSVSLAATGSGGATFVWTGACSGSGDCSISLGGDASVTATFTAPADACAGITVPTVAMQTFVAGTSELIDGPSASTDLAGVVYVVLQSSAGSDVQVVNSTGHSLQPARFFPVAYLSSGYAALEFIPQGIPRNLGYRHYGADETQVGDSTNILNLLGETFPITGIDARGGSVVLGIGQDAAGSQTLEIYRFDDTNQLVSHVSQPDPDGTQGGTPMIDAQGLLLIVQEASRQATANVPAGHLAARWLDADSNNLTDWFDAGAADLFGVRVRPLIGGGAAIRTDKWNATIPSGKAQANPPPAFLTAGDDFSIVLGGTAYAVFPGAQFTPQGTIQPRVVAPSGKTCAQLPPVGDDQSFLSIGRDGTFMALTGPVHGTVQYYPALLK